MTLRNQIAEGGQRPGKRVASLGSRGGVSLMLLLTFVTGIVDAVGYLALDRVFTGNMTGNVVILAMALGGGDGLPVLGPLIALGTFTIGAIVAGLTLRYKDSGWSTAVVVLLLADVVLLAGAAVLLLVAPPIEAVIVIAAAVTAAAMGLQAALARKIAVADMPTVVVTSTLTSWACETVVLGGLGAVWNRRLGALLVIFAGALAGTLLLPLGAAVPMLVAAALTVAVGVSGYLTGARGTVPR